MNLSESNLAVREKLAKYSNTDANDWFLCLKARYGMATVFKTIRNTLGPGDVITTPYTCITSVNPILVADLKPVYADIDPTTLSITDANKHIRKHTRAIVVQHTLGIINQEIQSIGKTCKEEGIILVEDSAHCLARMALDNKSRPIADISIHSFGVEKVLQNTKFGGAIYVNPRLKKTNPKLYEVIVHNLINLPEAPRALDLKIRAYRTQNAILQRVPNVMKNGLRNFLLKTKTFEPAVTPIEQDATQAESYAITDYACQVILKNIPSLPADYRRREQNTEIYQKYLKSASYFHIISEKKEPLLAFPVVFEDSHRATEAYNALASSGYFIRRWYSPLLYPGPTDNRFYFYNPKMSPVAEAMHPRVICLPTNLSTVETKKIINILYPVQNHVENYKQTVENSLDKPKKSQK
ncbi:MAG: DegT/DnrJ/EryC1/StrS family aminotransferase [Candidatus Saccharibacteria bacterium]|nr:DegT/DnrJ/EryC1/StrS family aminotransferase [Candidatus Saccharibacteria bacterium]